MLDGVTDLLRLSEPRIALAGVGRKFQKPSVFRGTERGARTSNWRCGCTSGRSLRNSGPGAIHAGRSAWAEVLEEIGLTERAEAPAGILAHGQKQWLEIGMLLMQRPKLLMLDEPVAGMTDAETSHTADLVRRLRAPDRAILVIEHEHGLRRGNRRPRHRAPRGRADLRGPHGPTPARTSACGKSTWGATDAVDRHLPVATPTARP